MFQVVIFIHVYFLLLNLLFLSCLCVGACVCAQALHQLLMFVFGCLIYKFCIFIKCIMFFFVKFIQVVY